MMTFPTEWKKHMFQTTNQKLYGGLHGHGSSPGSLDGETCWNKGNTLIKMEDLRLSLF